MANEFLVSVANAILRDTVTGNALAYGKANIESGFTLSTSETEVRGGKNNALLYTYIHDRTLEVNVNQATFDKVLLGLNVGQLAVNGAVEVTQTDCIVLSGGSGTLAATPTGNVTVFLPSGTVTTVTPTGGSEIYVPSGSDSRIDAVYNTTTTADQITVETETPPSVVDLTLLADVYSSDGVISEYLQINVPRFQVMGNYTLSLTASGVSEQALTGKALVNASTDCTTNDYYAKVTWIPASSATIAVSNIAAIPSTITFLESSLPDTSQISVLGIRGGIYANANVTEDCVFARHSFSGSDVISVDANGLVTASASGSADDSALISATYYSAASGSIVDYVQVDID